MEGLLPLTQWIGKYVTIARYQRDALDDDLRLCRVVSAAGSEIMIVRVGVERRICKQWVRSHEILAMDVHPLNLILAYVSTPHGTDDYSSVVR